jgi:hypothetical protein
MEQNQIGWLVVAAGVLAGLVAVLADPLGIGGTEGYFGWKQGILLGIGVVLVIGGAAVLLREPEEAEGTGGAEGPEAGARAPESGGGAPEPDARPPAGEAGSGDRPE